MATMSAGSGQYTGRAASALGGTDPVRASGWVARSGWQCAWHSAPWCSGPWPIEAQVSDIAMPAAEAIAMGGAVGVIAQA